MGLVEGGSDCGITQYNRHLVRVKSPFSSLTRPRRNVLFSYDEQLVVAGEIKLLNM